jgi:rhamnulokinase
MTAAVGQVAAVDLGATSGRVMLGHVGPDELSFEVVHRFPNDPVRTRDGLHWNILELYRNALLGLGKAVRARPELASVGIDSWAVDYGLVSGERMINNPFHYRDDRTAG